MANDPTIVIPDGRLGAEPDPQTSKNGKQYLRLRFGVTPYHYDKNTRQTVQAESQWWSCVEFDEGRIQGILRDLHKGDSCRIEGVLEVDTYVNRNGETQIDRSIKFPRISKNIRKPKQQQTQQQQTQQQQSYQQPQSDDQPVTDPWADNEWGDPSF